MFGLSWGQILIIVLVGAFVLGPERIPTGVNFTLGMIRKARNLAAGTQATLLRDLGPEIEELRRQVADLQSLKELADLRQIGDLHPRQWIGDTMLAAPPPPPPPRSTAHPYRRR
jgi:sec-independent protein translocase protein TatB